MFLDKVASSGRSPLSSMCFAVSLDVWYPVSIPSCVGTPTRKATTKMQSFVFLILVIICASSVVSTVITIYTTLAVNYPTAPMDKTRVKALYASLCFSILWYLLIYITVMCLTLKGKGCSPDPVSGSKLFLFMPALFEGQSTECSSAELLILYSSFGVQWLSHCCLYIPLGVIVIVVLMFTLCHQIEEIDLPFHRRYKLGYRMNQLNMWVWNMGALAEGNPARLYGNWEMGIV